MLKLIDFHSHVLPGIDDGSDSVDTSIAMLRMEAEQGVTHVVATPHFYPHRDRPEEFLARRSRAEEKLRREMAKHNDLPQLIIGTEVYFFPGIGQSEALPLLTFGKKECIMIEMPQSSWTEAMYQELRQVHGQLGLVPVIAHVDRYLSALRNPCLMKRLEAMPVIVQANASFFLGRGTACQALRMVKAGKIHLLGSDCHNLQDRCPNLGAAVQRIREYAGEQYVEEICSCGRSLLNV